MRDYELVLVVSPDAGDEGFPTTLDRVTSFIQERGGEIKDVDPWGRRRLAYPIGRFTEGFYAVTHFSLEPDQVRALEGNLDLAEDVLRHLVVRGRKPLPAPKAGAGGGSNDGGRPVWGGRVAASFEASLADRSGGPRSCRGRASSIARGLSPVASGRGCGSGRGSGVGVACWVKLP